MSATTKEIGEVLDKFYAALAAKNLPGAADCCTPDIVFWHSFDGVCQTLEQAQKGWQGMFSNLQEHRVADVRREFVGNTVIQRHLFVMGQADGTRAGRACCIIARAFQGRLQRVDEYIDLSSDLLTTPDDDTTKGLPENGNFV